MTLKGARHVTKLADAKKTTHEYQQLFRHYFFRPCFSVTCKNIIKARRSETWRLDIGGSGNT